MCNSLKRQKNCAIVAAFIPRIPVPLRKNPTLAAALLVAVPGAPVAAQPLCLSEDFSLPPQDTVVEDADEERLVITAGRMNLVGEDTIEFDDRVDFRYGGGSLSAERARFHLDTQTAEVQGTVSYRNRQVTVYGDDAEMDTRNRVIAFEGGGFDLPQRPARGGAEAVRIRGDNTITLETVTFTTCPTATPDWELLARELEMDVEGGSGIARGFRLNFKGVPILAAPYVTFPLDDRRKSGLLTPSFSNRGRTGLDISVPVYLNLAPNYDLTVTSRYMHERGAQANSEFRYLLPGTEGQVRFEYLPEDSRTGESRRYLNLTHETMLGMGWRIIADIQDISDDFYFEDLHNSLSAASQTHLNRAVEFSYRAPRWSLRGRVQDYQTIDPFIGAEDEPYRRAPQFLFSGDWPGNVARFSSRNELVQFDRAEGAAGWRLDLDEELSLAFTRPGMFLTPGVGLRHTRYWLEEDPGSGEAAFSRTLPVASIDAGLKFERRPERPRGWIHTVEPRALYVRIPFEDQAAFPLFDTVEPTFNFVQLFRKYRYLGADRIADTEQLSLGVTTRLIDIRSGREKLVGTFGQTRYLSPQKVRLPDAPAAGGSVSDYIAEVAMSLQPSWRLGVDYQWDSEASETARTEARFEFRPREDRMLGIAYRYQEGFLEQGDVSVAWPLGNAWRVVARASYSLLDGKPLERFLGWEYASCCWSLRVSGRRYISRRTGASDRSITLQFLLRGFTDPGESAETLLDRGILGYRRFDVTP